MKNKIYKTAFLLLPILALAFFAEIGVSSNSETQKTATCPITITFCIDGAGSGRSISIFPNNNCNTAPMVTIYTGSDGCAQYTFNENCSATFTVHENCLFGPSGQCSYFVPINVPGSKISVKACN